MTITPVVKYDPVTGPLLAGTLTVSSFGVLSAGQATFATQFQQTIQQQQASTNGG
jgi:hypothetical protein